MAKANVAKYLQWLNLGWPPAIPAYLFSSSNQGWPPAIPASLFSGSSHTVPGLVSAAIGTQQKRSRTTSKIKL